jgi:hypothetical protein
MRFLFFKIKQHEEASMAIPLDPNQIVSFEELLISQVVQQEALSRLLVEKGIFTKEEFLEMVRVVDRKMKKKREGAYIFLQMGFTGDLFQFSLTGQTNKTNLGDIM